MDQFNCQNDCLLAGHAAAQEQAQCTASSSGPSANPSSKGCLSSKHKRAQAWAADTVDVDAIAEQLEEELEWEEWNGRGSFGHHMIAGSCAGIVEHVCMFPVDTFKTHSQTYFAQQAVAHAAGTAGPAGPPPTFFNMLRQVGMVRLWRGAPAVMLGCIPSHAAYFSAYEFGRETFGLNSREAEEHKPLAAAATGALATVLHDGIITPMDVVKQRMQLGYYKGLLDSIRSVIATEGARSLWRSYPTTVVMNIPYAAAVVAANESFKTVFTPMTGKTSMLTYILAGAGAGAIAAAVTTPLDVIKTRLQTAAVLQAGSGPGNGGTGTGGGGTTPTFQARSSGPVSQPAPSSFQQVQVAFYGTDTRQGGSPAAAAVPGKLPGALDIAKFIWKEEGLPGFFRGMRARMAVHTPSQAISWATYEGLRGLLMRWSGAGSGGSRGGLRDS